MRLAALRLLLLASMGVVGFDAFHYCVWPFSLGVAVLLWWGLYSAYLFSARNIVRSERPSWRL